MFSVHSKSAFEWNFNKANKKSNIFLQPLASCIGKRKDFFFTRKWHEIVKGKFISCDNRWVYWCCVTTSWTYSMTPLLTSLLVAGLVHIINNLISFCIYVAIRLACSNLVWRGKKCYQPFDLLDMIQSVHCLLSSGAKPQWSSIQVLLIDVLFDGNHVAVLILAYQDSL